jgi:hypothetical protein
MLLIDSLNQLGHKIRQLEESKELTYESMDARMVKFSKTHELAIAQLLKIPRKNFVAVAATLTADLENNVRLFEIFLLESEEQIPAHVDKATVSPKTLYARISRVFHRTIEVDMPKRRQMAMTQLMFDELESECAYHEKLLKEITPRS